jgi:hypothetical protein
VWRNAAQKSWEAILEEQRGINGNRVCCDWHAHLGEMRHKRLSTKRFGSFLRLYNINPHYFQLQCQDVRVSDWKLSLAPSSDWNCAPILPFIPSLSGLARVASLMPLYKKWCWRRGRSDVDHGRWKAGYSTKNHLNAVSHQKIFGQQNALKEMLFLYSRKVWIILFVVLVNL